MEEEDYENSSSKCIIIHKGLIENENILKLNSSENQDVQLSPTSNSISASTSSSSIGSIDLLIEENKEKKIQQEPKKIIFPEKIKIINIPNNNITTDEGEEEKKFENISDSCYGNKNKENESINIYCLIKKSNHPLILFFSFLVELTTVLLFFIEDNSKFNSSFFSLLITIINGINFWFTKNISGRIILGMHWWKEVKPKYQEKWLFGRQIDFKISNIYDNNFFWTVLYSSTTLWGVFLLVKILEMNLIMIIACLVSFLLSFFNAFGYNRCANEQKINGIIDTNV